MENLMLSFGVVAPLLILMLLGALSIKVKLLDYSAVKKMNNAVFKIFLPALIFNNVYTSSVEDLTDMRTAFYISSVYICAFILAIIFIGFIEKDPGKKGSMVQGMCRSNFVIFGVPLCESLCGSGSLGKISVAVAIAIPVLNVFSVIVLEYFRGSKPDVKTMLKGIITNPLIISSAVGIIALVSGIKLPEFIAKAVEDTAKIATPLALFLLGASINLSAVKGNLKRLVIVLTVKLVMIPFVGIAVAAYMGMRGVDIAILLAAFASPTAVSSYPMALQMGGDGPLAAQIVAFTTTLCILTVFVWIFVLKQVGLL